jgi:sphinganine-1-phosphate aldolase
MKYLGDEGYLDCARIIMDTKRELMDAIRRIPGLAVLEPSELAIFVTRSADPAVDIGAVSDAMVARGWFIGRQAEPPGIHMHINPVHRESWKGYVADLRAAVDEVRAKKATGKAAGSTY